MNALTQMLEMPPDEPDPSYTPRADPMGNVNALGQRLMGIAEDPRNAWIGLGPMAAMAKIPRVAKGLWSSKQILPAMNEAKWAAQAPETAALLAKYRKDLVKGDLSEHGDSLEALQQRIAHLEGQGTTYEDYLKAYAKEAGIKRGVVPTDPMEEIGGATKGSGIQ